MIHSAHAVGEHRLATERLERRLAAILAADLAGYSRLMNADEEGTHKYLKAHFRNLVDPKIKIHRGRIVKNTGDGMLAEFPSVVDAVRCAVEIQHAMIDCNADIPEGKRIRFRIGINLGDVIAEPEDIFGDGVNIAARLEALAEPGGICISRVVRDQIRDKLPYPFEDMGEQSVKGRGYLPALAQAAGEGCTPLPPLKVPAVAHDGPDPSQRTELGGQREALATGPRWPCELLPHEAPPATSVRPSSRSNGKKRLRRRELRPCFVPRLLKPN